MFVFGDGRLCADGVLPVFSKALLRERRESSADVLSGDRRTESLYGLGENLGMMSLPSDLFLSCNAGNVIANGVNGGEAGKLYFSVLVGRSMRRQRSEQ